MKMLTSAKGWDTENSETITEIQMSAFKETMLASAMEVRGRGSVTTTSHGIRDVEVEAGVEIASGIEGDEKNIKISPGDDRDRRQENARKDDGQEAKIERIIGEATEKEENREEIAANRLTTVVRTGEEMIITSGGDKGGSFVTRAWRWR